VICQKIKLSGKVLIRNKILFFFFHVVNTWQYSHDKLKENKKIWFYNLNLN